MAHPLLEDAKRQAETLSAYTVCRMRCLTGWSFALFRKDTLLRSFPTPEAAEAHLFAQLPKIPATRGDRVRSRYG